MHIRDSRYAHYICIYVYMYKYMSIYVFMYMPYTLYTIHYTYLYTIYTLYTIQVITDVIKADNKRGLMRVVAVISFFLSGILDNLTTTIVMVSLVKKLLPELEDR
jgi:Na+/H+ antiporter NhaD/arsenite permease-like protein